MEPSSVFKTSKFGHVLQRLLSFQKGVQHKDTAGHGKLQIAFRVGGSQSRYLWYLRNFFSEVLSERELSRRENALKIQRTQFRIMSGWDKQVKSMSQDSGYSASEFARFGNVVGAPVFPPAPESSIVIKRTPEMIEFLEKDSSGLHKQWKTYLEQWKTYLGPEEIASDKIHDWIAQGLDVNRMLKIVDYTLEHKLSTFSSLGTAETYAKSLLPSGWTSPLLHFSNADASKLELYLKFTGIRLTDKQKQYLDKLYSALSVSEKESNTRVHATAEEFELLSKWKETDPVTHGMIRTFFTRALSERELVRRESVLNLQQAKLRIISGWSEQWNLSARILVVRCLKWLGGGT
ncbi:hypothetical protein H4Q26_016328 [Puccinia striiformis f. sp. tritici PST-130]|nr:hypothetical protein H4Q26_016328 [Puccinia striiformis f. sp. tritici PST-130]